MKALRTASASSSCCPHCGARLIWDYGRGEVVCPECGTVAESTMYDFTAPHTVQGQQRRVRAKVRIVSLREIKALQEMAWVEDKKSLSLAVVRNLPESVRNACEHGIKVAEECSPTLTCGKTLRAKYAVGYITHSLLTGREINEKFIARTFHLSTSSARRLVKLVEGKLRKTKIPAYKLSS